MQIQRSEDGHHDGIRHEGEGRVGLEWSFPDTTGFVLVLGPPRPGEAAA